MFFSVFFFRKSILPSILKVTVQLKLNVGKGVPCTSGAYLVEFCWYRVSSTKSNFIVFSLPGGMLVHVRITPP